MSTVPRSQVSSVRTSADPRFRELVAEFVERYRSRAEPEEYYPLLITAVRQHEDDMTSAVSLLRRWKDADPDGLWRRVAHVLRSGIPAAEQEIWMDLLASERVLLIPLADPLAFSLEDALTLAQELQELHPALDVDLLGMISAQLDTDHSAASVHRVGRVLDIVDRIAPVDRLNTLFVKLLRHPNSQIRSKVTLLLTRSARNLAWVERQLAHSDPRVRANAVEGLWSVDDSDRKRALLWRATRDTHQRVVGNALVGLCKMGDQQAFRALEEMATHPVAAFRASAAWAMGEVGSPRFLDILPSMSRDPESPVKRNALRARVRIRRNQSSESTVTL